MRGGFFSQPENIVYKSPPPCSKVQVFIVDFNLACLVEPAKLKVSVMAIHLYSLIIVSNVAQMSKECILVSTYSHLW
jgi:hypothetical protein